MRDPGFCSEAVRGVGGERWAGESSRCEDPAPTVGIAGHCHRPSFTPADINGNGVGG